MVFLVVDLARADLTKEIFNELAKNRSEILVIGSNNSEKIIVLNEGNELPIKTFAIKDESKDDGTTPRKKILQTYLLDLALLQIIYIYV